MRHRTIIIIFITLFAFMKFAVIYAENDIQNITPFELEETEICKRLDDDHYSFEFHSFDETIPNFYNEFSKKICLDYFSSQSVQGKNAIISPLLAYRDLLLLYFLSNDTVKNQILDIIDLDEIDDTILFKVFYLINFHNLYTSYFKYGPTIGKNSVWFSKNITPGLSYIDNIKKVGNTEIYQTVFNQEGIDIINKWASHYTNNSITDINLKQDDFVDILFDSTLYFDNLTRDFVYKYNRKDPFYGSDDVNYIQFHASGSYKYEDNYMVIIELLQNGIYIKYYIPYIDYLNEHSLTDLFFEETFFEQIKSSERLSGGTFELIVPKFKVNTVVPLDETFENIGLNFLKNFNKCNLNNDVIVANDEVANLNFSFKQNLSFCLETERNLAQKPVMSCSCISGSIDPSIKEFGNFIIDRPFIYQIYRYNGYPLLYGMVNEV